MYGCVYISVYVYVCVCLYVCNARNTHYATNYIAAAADDVEAEADLNLYCILCGVAGVFNLSSQCAFHVHDVAVDVTADVSHLSARCAVVYLLPELH